MENKNNFNIKIDYNDPNVYDNFEDISSSRKYTDVSSSSKNGKHYAKKKKKKKNKKLIILLSVILAIILALGVGFYAYTYSLLKEVNHVKLNKDDLGITSNEFEDYINIALLGIDTRQDNDSGRSDANIILTIDKKHKKVKLTTIARDTYVEVEGHGKDKLTDAYAYGKSQLTVKTLNQNFNLEIGNYATINFFGLARIIDYLGGITLDIDSREMRELNTNIIPYAHFGDTKCEKIKSAGVQKVSGQQAVCYARIRKTDGDVERGNRQKEVLTAMFNSVKNMSPLKLPEVAKLVLGECETSLSTDDIMDIGSWALLNTPEFEQISLPNDNVKGKGQTIGGVWYYVYDIEAATKEIKDFIFEENFYSKENKEEKSSEISTPTK